MQNSKQVLCSCFRAHAQLNANLAAVRNELEHFKCLRAYSSGTRLVYTVSDAVKKNNEALLELCKDSISLTFFFAKPDSAEYTHNLLKFISILAYLKRSYSIDFTGVYGYVIEALHNSWSFSLLESQPSDGVLRQRIDALNEANATLSHEFVSLSRKKNALEKKINIYKSFCTEVMEKATSRDRKGEAVPHTALYSLGVDNSEIRAVTSLMAEKE